MKIILIKDTKKIIIGKWHFKSPFLVNSILSYKNTENRFKKKGRTHWIRINFKQRTILVGDKEVNLTSKDLRPLGGCFSYLICDDDPDNHYLQYVSHNLNELKILKTPTLVQNEEIAVIYTYIDNHHQNRSNITNMLLQEIQKCLDNYQAQVCKDHSNKDIPMPILNSRLKQIETVTDCLKEWPERSQQIYRTCNGQDFYFIQEY